MAKAILTAAVLLMAPMLAAQELKDGIAGSLTILDGVNSGTTMSFVASGAEIEKSVPWQKHRNSEGDSPTLEFTAGDPKTLHVELMFDTFEDAGAAMAKAQDLEVLEQIDVTLKRPPLLMVEFAKTKMTAVMRYRSCEIRADQNRMYRLKCVLELIATPKVTVAPGRPQ